MFLRGVIQYCKRVWNGFINLFTFKKSETDPVSSSTDSTHNRSQSQSNLTTEPQVDKSKDPIQKNYDKTKASSKKDISTKSNSNGATNHELPKKQSNLHNVNTESKASTRTKETTGSNAKKAAANPKIKYTEYGSWKWNEKLKLYSRSVTICYDDNSKAILPTLEEDKNWLHGIISSCRIIRLNTDNRTTDQLELQLKSLQKRNISPNVQTNYGNTPLHTAILVGDLSAIKLLLDNGASLFIKNKWSETPYSLLLNLTNLSYVYNSYDKKEKIIDLLSSDEKIYHNVKEQESKNGIIETITTSKISSNLRSSHTDSRPQNATIAH